MSIFGQGDNCYVIPTQDSVGTTAIVSKITFIQRPSILSYILKTGAASDTTDTLDATVLVEVSNDAWPGGGGQIPNLTPLALANTAIWVTAPTGLFTPALVSVVHGTPATKLQFTQAVLGVRAVRFTITPTAGKGSVTLMVAGGDY